MTGWRDIGRDVQHLILWDYVYNTKPNDSRSKIPISPSLEDEKSIYNSYLASKCFHILSEWEKELITSKTGFYKRYVSPYFLPNDLSSDLEKRPYEHLINSYISHKSCQKNDCEYKMGPTMFKYYVDKYKKGLAIKSWKENDVHSLEYMALTCCKNSMGKLFRFIIEHYNLKICYVKKQWCIDYLTESGDIKTVLWMNDKYGIIPSRESINEAFLLGIYELTRVCINRFNYKPKIKTVLDAFMMNNLKSVNIALDLNLVDLKDIEFDYNYIYDLFSYGCIKSINWGIKHDKIQKDSLFEIFKINIGEWSAIQMALHEKSLETLKIIDIKIYIKVIKIYKRGDLLNKILFK
jgi:hypothetical protein